MEFPQVSVIGLLPFILYTADIIFSFTKLQCCCSCSAGDVRTFFHGPPLFQLPLVARIQSLTNYLITWMSSNILYLNASETQFI